jgi:hypothetical protein
LRATSSPSSLSNIFLTVNEAFELSMSKSPFDIRKSLKPNVMDNWTNDLSSNSSNFKSILPFDRSSYLSHLSNFFKSSSPFELNSHFDVQQIRRTRGDLIEDVSYTSNSTKTSNLSNTSELSYLSHPSNFQLTTSDKIALAKQHLALLEGHLPTSPGRRVGDLQKLLKSHCSMCGMKDHKV